MPVSPGTIGLAPKLTASGGKTSAARHGASRRKRILFFGEGITMTHFARPAALAAALNPAEYEIHFRTPRRYHALLPASAIHVGDLRTIDPHGFLEALGRGSTLYSFEALRGYVHDDMELINAVQPDLVIGDFRLSLCVSAPQCGVPFASIFNAHWSPYTSQPVVVPELPITRWLSPRVLRPLFAALRPAVYALHAKPLNDLRVAFGLGRISSDMRKIYTAGHLVLHPDVPEFVSTHGAPEHHHYIGICNWAPSAPKPAWWAEAMSSPRPRVFVSLGSSGAVRALPAVLEALAPLPITTILATSGRPVGPIPPHIYAADLLPYEETASQCTAVISHGGTGGLYPTLAAGAPMLAIPSNIDNHLSSALLEKCGAGLSVRVENATPQRLRAALQRLLAEPHFKRSAEHYAAAIRAQDTRELFPALLNRWLTARKTPVPRS